MLEENQLDEMVNYLIGHAKSKLWESNGNATDYSNSFAVIAYCIEMLHQTPMALKGDLPAERKKVVSEKRRFLEAVISTVVRSERPDLAGGLLGCSVYCCYQRGQTNLVDTFLTGIGYQKNGNPD